MRARPTSSLALLPVLVVLLGGCAASDPGAGVAHDEPELAVYEGERARLRSDLPPTEAEVFLARLETLELVCDAAFPFLPAPAARPLTLVLADPARFALAAQEHRTESAAGAFLCAQGELYLRWRPEVWGSELDGPALRLEPRVRPLASAILRRRLLAAHGADLAPSWLEEGMAAVFVELAAHELGDERQAVRVNRERLLDAFLPLYLGAEPTLARVASARGRATMKRVGSPALAWAVARFLLAEADRVELLREGLEHAARPEAQEAAWEGARARLVALEDAFVTFLRDALLEELLLAYAEAPTQVDRWESAAALRVVANLDLDADADDATRPLLVRGGRELLLQDPGPLRFLDPFEPELAKVRAARSRLQAMARLGRLVRAEFERRTQGYGHPAIEAARADLGRALQRALERGASK